jgi:tetratricopeptide (TPR) repeat protein
LSKELDEKLASQHRTASPRAVAVIGLGGTGKTQLVLNYIEQHEAEYDTVLWIDVREKETARASFERCCRALSLPVEPSPEDQPLQDVPCVQAVLVWLRARAEEHKWLTVVDNADDLSWDVSSIIPRGKAGTVLVTSQDGQASRLLGGRIPAVKVDAMQPEEAVRLVANHFGEPVTQGDCYWDLVEKITEFLDRLALPLDLAGARISVDAENWGDLTTALKQYFEDYGHNQERLLHDTEYANATPYKKTAWTAWETSLSSLRAKEESHSGIYPVKLLSFLTLFDRTNVQDELFRLASLGLPFAQYGLGAAVPSWLRTLLEKNGKSEWNSLLYRNTLACLMRYGLVRPIIGPWKGVTMHGLVQIRAQQELPPGYSQWHMLILGAICLVANEGDHVRFRRHLTVHLPSSDTLLTGQPPFQNERQTTRLWQWIGEIFASESRVKEAVQLQAKAAAVMSKAFGDKDPETLDAMSGLAVAFAKQGRFDESKDIISEVVLLREAALGVKHPDTLLSRYRLACAQASLGCWDESENEHMAILALRRAVLGHDHRDTLRSMESLATACYNMGKRSKAQELRLEMFETRKRLYGRAHPDTISSMSIVAEIHSKQGNYREADNMQVEAIQAATDLFGDDHEATLLSVNRLATSYQAQGKLSEAEELQIKVIERFQVTYGKNHPETLRHMRHLARTRVLQGKLTEAQKMLLEVLDEQTRVLGEAHADTLGTMDGLAVTLQGQGRWQEALDLGVKMMADSSRTLGEKHPQTLRTVAILAHSKWALGQCDVAVDLMRKTAVAHSEVFGDDHPETRRRHETLAEWSCWMAKSK